MTRAWFRVIGAALIGVLTAACSSGGPGWDGDDGAEESASYLLVANSGSDNISVFKINATTGGLTAVAGSPFGAGPVPSAIVADPSGAFAYVANWESGSVSAYAIDAGTGKMTPAGGPPVATGAGPCSMAMTSHGNLAWVSVANSLSNDISLYTVQAHNGETTGVLTPFEGSPFAAAAGSPRGIAFFDNDGDLECYSTYPAAGRIISSWLNGYGVPPMAPLQEFAAGEGPWAVAFDLSHRFIYAVNAYSGDISAYRMTPPAAPAEVDGSPFAAGDGPCAVAVGPQGHFAYVANGTSNTLSVYAIDGTTGALVPVAGSPFAAGVKPSAVAVDPAGKFVYVANELSQSVSAYAINASTGALSPVVGSPFAAGTGPCSIVVIQPIFP